MIMESAENEHFVNGFRYLRGRLLLGNLPVNAHVRSLAVVVMHKLSINEIGEL